MVIGSGEFTGAGRLALALPGACWASKGMLVSTTLKITKRRVFMGLPGILMGMEVTVCLAFDRTHRIEDSIPCSFSRRRNPIS